MSSESTAARERTMSKHKDEKPCVNDTIMVKKDGVSNPVPVYSPAPDRAEELAREIEAQYLYWFCNESIPTESRVSVVAALLRSQGESRQRDETAWLIERGGLCLGTCEYRLKWVTFTDPQALRFSRRADAYALKETLRFDPFNVRLENCEVTEHMWCLPSQPAETTK